MVEKRTVRKVLIAIEAPRYPQRFFHRMVPVGPLQVVSFLESRGVKTDIVDMNVSKQFPVASEYDAIGFGVTSGNIGPSLERAAMLKEEFPEMRIFAGGPEALCDPHFLCSHQQIDAVIVGEAEATIYHYLNSSNPGSVTGLILKDTNGKTFDTGRREWLLNLDRIPYPALDRVDISSYDSAIKQAKPISSIITSRGCSWRCGFCFHSHGHRWRARSASHVVSEIEWQVNRLGVKEICIHDDNFTHDQARVSHICRGIKERGIEVKLQLTSGIRVDCVSRELLEEMKQAGLWLVCLSPESGNQATLDRIHKGFTLERAKTVARWARELHLCTWASFILGYPWEGEKEMERTIRYARELDADISQFTRLILFPGTPLYTEFAPGNTEYRNQGLFDRKREIIAAAHPLGEEFLSRMFHRAYHNTNLRPAKALALLRFVPFSSITYMLKYALATGNI